jgi:tRNA pseudouridine38-40 synthase
VTDRNIRLVLEYDGSDYSGWQKQPQAPTVQRRIEDCLELLCGHPVELLVAGRTDAGVHALGQVANFHTVSPMPAMRMGEVLNQLLPHDIRILSAVEVPSAFHATYHARARLYRYIIRNARDYTVFDRHLYHHVRQPLNLAAMKKAARFLEGTHDFTAFRGNLGKWARPKRNLMKARVTRKNDDIILEFLGKSFLHQMVRIICGTLLYVGLGKFKPDDVAAILKSKDRKRAGPTLPPNGLFLVKVFYPKVFPPMKKRKKIPEQE